MILMYGLSILYICKMRMNFFFTCQMTVLTAIFGDLNLRSRSIEERGDYEPEFLIIARIVFVLAAWLGGGYGRRLRACVLLVQRPVVVFRGTFLVTLLTALLVEPQREALTEFLQHAFLLALCTMPSILTSAGGHIGDIQDGRRLLEPGMIDQRDRGLGQGMLGCRVVRSRPLILFVAGPLSTVNKIFPASPFYSPCRKLHRMGETRQEFRELSRQSIPDLPYPGIASGIIEFLFALPLSTRFNLYESHREFKKMNLLHNGLRCGAFGIKADPKTDLANYIDSIPSFGS